MNSSYQPSEVKGGARPKVRNINKDKLPNFNSSLGSNNGPLYSEKNKKDPSTKFELTSNGESNINSSSLPLEKKHIQVYEGGVQITRAGLSPEWVEERIYIHYTPPPCFEEYEENYVDGAMDIWMEQIEYFKEDLTWLLNLPHHKFWSQIVYHKPVQEFLNSYLSNGPRWFDETPQDSGLLSVLSEIHSLVFLVYLRLSTYKESKDSFLSPEVFGNIIYDNYIFDICKLLDLCTLFGTSNTSLMQKMVQNVFNTQEKYYDDMKILISSVKDAFYNIEEKLGIFQPDVPQFATEDVDVSLYPEDLRDIVLYLLDCSSSVFMFLKIFPKASLAFHDQEFELSLATAYEKIIPNITERLSSKENKIDLLMTQKLERLVGLSRSTLMQLFRLILTSVCFQNSDLSKEMESFAQILTSCLDEKSFVLDYSSCFSLKDDYTYFKNKNADMTTIQFVKEALETIVREEKSEEESAVPIVESKESDTSGMNGYYCKETSSLSQIELESLITSVQDLLPDLGTGFVAECLRYYSYSTEEVINAFLECNLPPSLESLDRKMKLEDLKKSGTSNEPTSKEFQDDPKNTETQNSEPDVEAEKVPDILSTRKNLYDNDEFDFFSQSATLDKSKIHRGKASKETPIDAVDEGLKEKMKDIFNCYTSSAGFSIYEDELRYTSQYDAVGDYDDEYDDTYDDIPGVDDNTYDEKKHQRLPTIWGKGALNQRGMNFTGDDEEEEESETDPSQNQRDLKERPDNFRQERNPHRNKSWNQKESTVFNNNKNRGNRNATTNDRRNDGYRTNERRNDGYRTDDRRNDDFRNNDRRNDGYRPNDRRNDDSRINDRNAEQSTSENEPEMPQTKLSFEPFCENPEVVRERMARRRMSQQMRNRGYRPPPSQNTSQESSQGQGGPGHPKTWTKTNKHSGKSWRQGAPDDDSGNAKRHGGKYKEDTNHGKAQSQEHRRKMTHKNEEKRAGAQYKYRNNF